MNRFALLASCAALIALSLSGAGEGRAGQVQRQPGTAQIKTGTSEVIVDVAVTDKKGRLVTNLKPEEFTIYEDGVPQEISSLRLVGRDATEGGGKNQAASPRPLLTMILLDYSSTEFQNEKLIRDGAFRYIEEKMRPGDRMAIYALAGGFRTLSPFTSDKQVLKKAFDWREQVDAAKAGTRPDANLSSSISVSTPAVSGSTTAGGDLGGADRMAGLFNSLQSGVEQRSSRDVLAAISALSQGVSNLEGRKALILFSQGFVVDPIIQEQMKASIAAAQKANVSIYSFDPGGLANNGGVANQQQREELGTAIKQGADQQDRMLAAGGQSVFDRAAVAGRDMGESALRYISTETGGFPVLRTNDFFVPGFQRVDQDMRECYVLTYHPKNPAVDGKFRSIRVEMRQPNLTVRARSGYYAVPAGLGALSPSELQFLLAGRAAVPASGGTLFLKTAGLREPAGRYRVPVIMEIPARNVQFAREGARYNARLSVFGLVRNMLDPEELPATFARAAQLDLGEAEYKALEPGSMSLMENLRLKPGTYSMEIVVRDLRSGKYLRSEQGIYLRDQEQKLALSTILLSNQFGKATKDDETNPNVLLTQGVKIAPCSQCEFRNGENMIYYVEVYNPKIDPQTKKADLTVNLILRQDGRPVNVTLPGYRLNEGVPQGKLALPIARFLQLSKLQPGDYSLVVQVTDSLANRVEAAHATFRITS